MEEGERRGTPRNGQSLVKGYSVLIGWKRLLTCDVFVDARELYFSLCSAPTNDQSVDDPLGNARVGGCIAEESNASINYSLQRHYVVPVAVITSP